MADFLKMAKSGRIYVFGNKNLKFNPINGEDLAKVCVNAIESDEKEIKITHLPDWIRKFTLWLLRTFTSSKTYGPIEFFLTVMNIDMSAPQNGEHKLEDFFNLKVKD